MSIRYFSEWTRRSCYILQKHKEKGAYITSAHPSELVTYDPFSCDNDILLEILSIGKDAGVAMLDFRILDFCNRYGLLGFGQAVLEKEYDNSTAKLYADNVFGEKLISDQKLMDLIFPFDRYSHRVKKSDLMPITTRWEIACDIEGSHWPLFDQFYAERVDWISIYARHLYELLVCFHKNEPFEYPLGNVKCKLSCYGAAKAIWQYDSLKSAIDIMFIQLLQHPSPAIRLCKWCLTPFRVPVGTRATYCSTSCRNVLNVKKSRQKKNMSD